ncbi:hypothetical protein CEXT_385001 [Caerostris extrusa]|uniref:Uncharacterized protein n=1 Tax=Caerostris extrusa TaxID=172846 RepID=A0AAV4M5X6_CAEEX|nr:hypothetical protein CEXT_385001 [Caerostris extrusa]
MLSAIINYMTQYRLPSICSGPSKGELDLDEGEGWGWGASGPLEGQLSWAVTACWLFICKPNRTLGLFYLSFEIIINGGYLLVQKGLKRNLLTEGKDKRLLGVTKRSGSETLTSYNFGIRCLFTGETRSFDRFYNMRIDFINM